MSVWFVVSPTSAATHHLIHLAVYPPLLADRGPTRALASHAWSPAPSLFFSRCRGECLLRNPGGGGKRVHKETRVRGATARRSKGAWARRQGGKDCACFEAPRHECIAPEELYMGHKSVGEHCTSFLPPSVFAAASEMEHESEAACPNTLECEQDKRASVP